MPFTPQSDGLNTTDLTFDLVLLRVVPVINSFYTFSFFLSGPIRSSELIISKTQKQVYSEEPKELNRRSSSLCFCSCQVCS